MLSCVDQHYFDSRPLAQRLHDRRGFDKIRPCTDNTNYLHSEVLLTLRKSRASLSVDSPRTPFSAPGVSLGLSQSVAEARNALKGASRAAAFSMTKVKA